MVIPPILAKSRLSFAILLATSLGMLYGCFEMDNTFSHIAPGTWRAKKAISGGGFLFDCGAHMLNTVTDLVGTRDIIPGGASDVVFGSRDFG